MDPPPDTRLGRDVALKVLAPLLAADDSALGRFEQEARAVSALAHPNIVTIFDVGTDEATRYIVTELLDGVTLRERLGRGPLPLATALDLAIQVTTGLAAAHAAGIVHRDIKPENVFVTRGGAAKLLDFGVSRLTNPPAQDAAGGGSTVAEARRTQEGTLLGTPAYMAPEQVRGLPVDGRADVFAVGCLLHEMLSGVVAFERPTRMDTFAAILAEDPPPLSTGVPLIDRTVQRCLRKDPAERFQSSADLTFVLEAACDAAGVPTSHPHQPPARSARLWPVWTALAAAAASAATWAVVAKPARAAADRPSLQATVIVPASVRPLAPAISPDGTWVAYLGLKDGQPDLYTQFRNGGAPVNLTHDLGMPVQNRSIIGGIDITPDGRGVTVVGRPQPIGVWRTRGIWVLPAPGGGPPRRITDRYSSLRWSPDGRHMAGVIAQPVVGDALAVASVDGQDERVIVSATNGWHLHQVAWSHDGRHLYYARSLEVDHSLSEIHRVPVEGGAPEVVVASNGTAVFPAPTPDGSALIYAGDHGGEGLNLWLRPLDGSPEYRLTHGVGEYTEPYVSRNGTQLVCLAKRQKGEVVRIPIDGTAVTPAIANGAGLADSSPSTALAGTRIFVSSLRSGRRQIWSLDPAGGRHIPLTEGASDAGRPVVSPDGKSVAFIASRDGRRGIWMVPSEGGSARRLVQADAVDFVSWAPDNRRLVYAAPDGADLKLWVMSIDGSAPAPIAGVSGRVPAWSRTGDVIAYVATRDDLPELRFVSTDGREARAPAPLGEVGVPTAIGWSPDGAQIALVNLPGREAAEAWLLTIGGNGLRKLAEFSAPAELEGIAWTPDGRSVLVGRRDFETEVVLIDGLKSGTQRAGR